MFALGYLRLTMRLHVSYKGDEIQHQNKSGLMLKIILFQCISHVTRHSAT